MRELRLEEKGRAGVSCRGWGCRWRAALKAGRGSDSGRRVRHGVRRRHVVSSSWAGAQQGERGVAGVTGLGAGVAMSRSTAGKAASTSGGRHATLLRSLVNCVRAGARLRVVVVEHLSGRAAAGTHGRGSGCSDGTCSGSGKRRRSATAMLCRAETEKGKRRKKEREKRVNRDLTQIDSNFCIET